GTALTPQYNSGDFSLLALASPEPAEEERPREPAPRRERREDEEPARPGVLLASLFPEGVARETQVALDEPDAAPLEAGAVLLVDEALPRWDDALLLPVALVEALLEALG